MSNSNMDQSNNILTNNISTNNSINYDNHNDDYHNDITSHLLGQFKKWYEEQYNNHTNTNHINDTNDTNDINYKFNCYNINYNNKDEYQYLELLKQILNTDNKGRNTRNAPTYSIFGPQIEFNLQNGFPLLTTKKMFWRGIVEELLFFLKGDTNSNHLTEKNVNIWVPNTTRDFLDSRKLYDYEIGDMGPMYGWNWRHCSADYMGMNSVYTNKGFDQLKDILLQLKNDPYSRRIMMSSFDPSNVIKSVLVPCHGIVIQFYVNDNIMDCKMYQRSSDSFLGLPFNITSYALLMHILCKVTGYTPGKLIITLGDCHIYKDHKDVVLEQISRKPYKFPQLNILKEFTFNTHHLNNINNINDSELWINNAISYIESLTYDDFNVDNYFYHPLLKAQMYA